MRLPGENRGCTELPSQPIFGLMKEQEYLDIYTVATKVQGRRKFTDHPVQDLHFHFSEDSPEMQGDLLNVTQLFSVWPEPGNQSLCPLNRAASAPQAVSAKMYNSGKDTLVGQLDSLTITTWSKKSCSGGQR